MALSPESVSSWIALFSGSLAALLGLLKYFDYRSKRDRRAEVGASFARTIDALASDNHTSRMAGAVLLRRFFDKHTEQGGAGRAYVKEAVEVLAGMLREEQPLRIQKVLADGLRYAVDLRGADLQNCDLRNAYLGRKTDDARPVDLSQADLYGANCIKASFKEVVAWKTVFLEATLEKAVFTDADCREADFRFAKLSGAKFSGAQLSGARFEGADGVPEDVALLLDEHAVGLPDAVVRKAKA